MAPKGKGRWRPTGDFRRLNALTVPDRYPIPLIEDILLSLHGSTYFTTLDLNRAYFRYQLPQRTSQKRPPPLPLAFSNFWACHWDSDTPHRLSNGTWIICSETCRSSECTSTSLLIVSGTLDEHLEHLQAVFDTPVRAKLTLNLGKCQFVKREVIFLGYSVNADGFKPPRTESRPSWSTPGHRPSRACAVSSG